MDFSELKNYKTILVKPKDLESYHPMDVTPTSEGFTISNYGNKRLTEHEYLFKINDQKSLDKLDYMHS